MNIPEMNYLRLKYGYLYIDKELPLLQKNDKKGRTFIILGNAFCTDIYPKQISDDIQDFDGESILNLTQNWTGRWLLIQDNNLITDATGLMSAFYWANGGEWLISSSLSLISYVLDIPIERHINNNGLDWHLLPDTIIPSVRALFCTQMLKLGKILEVKAVSRFSDKSALTTEARVQEVTKRLQVALRNIERFSCRNILIALTAGKDSRLVLASALSSKIKFSTYTMEHSNMLTADKKLPGKIAMKYGFKWSFIKQTKQNAMLVDDYLHFNGGNSKGADLIFYSAGQHQQLPTNAIVIRSGIFEAGQQYGRHTMGDTMESLKTGFFKYYETSLKSDGQKAAFNKWEYYAKQYPIQHIDIRDRFYIEQRVNGWVSAIEQALTINDFETLQIANCQEIISVLLSTSEDERKNNRLAYCMIKSLDPDLLDYPVNKQSLLDKINIIKSVILKKIFRC